MHKYSRYNSIFGWLAFLVAAVVYTLTLEPTASFWDCSERITAAYKMQIPHPPGAPFFMLMGRFFSLFAPDVSYVAYTINLMSAMAGAFTIAFLFWSITHLAKKIVLKSEEAYNEPWRIWSVIAAGFVGAMAYTFSDSFWFVAVEAEAYATSSMFTAIVFWAILKWESIADEPHANRWLILIAYLIGLSIGVHLLNLLAIPAIVMVYYYKKYEVTRKNSLIALLTSFAILGFILYIIIPGTIKVAGWFELLFVNSFGLSFNSGLIFYTVALFGALAYGVYYTYVKQKAALNFILTAITVILMGYTSYATIIIRSSANPPMDQNSPDNVFALRSYLNREQYGDSPLFYGQYYNSPLDWDAMESEKGRPVYARIGDRYEVIDHRRKHRFDSRTTTFFPRMHSRDARHIEEYKQWANINGRRMTVQDQTGAPTTIQLPTFFENLTFFVRYQVNFMYFRYFMWNFSGRQNDMQGHGEVHKGNWITGISAIDNWMYGDQEILPDSYKNNPGRNKYYMLPLILGIIGLLYQYGSGKKGKRDFWVVMLLFFFTGLAIVIFLNQTPLQPRERDYSYVGSFYAFSIWIGLGVLAIIDGFRRFLPAMPAVAAGTLAVLVLVPANMAKENWNDHDRSGRTIARDLAFNYLNTVGENGVIFTMGDNDTFPLWYAQEVEGVRTDVRVCNLSYLQTDWYIDQMKRQAYESEPLNFSMEREQYILGKRDVVWLIDRIEGYVDLKEAIRFLASESPRSKQIPNYSGRIEHLPSKSFTIPADWRKVVENGMVGERHANLIDSLMFIDLNKERLMKNEVMVLDLLAHNDWERPIYFAVTVGSDNYVGLQDYFQLEGFAYQIVPIRTKSVDGQFGRVDTDRMFNNVMNEFIFDGWNDPSVYLDENHRRMGVNIRNNLSRLASALIEEGRDEEALAVLDKTMNMLPPSRLPHNYFSLFIADSYYQIGEIEKADEVIRGLKEENYQELRFFTNLPQRIRNAHMGEIQRSFAIYSEIVRTLRLFNRDELIREFEEDHERLFQRIGFFNR
ncbi:glycosyltransferase family 117 protein [Alkalitalea saponilacus]|uniref:DUF2723 domain-containing protein n=1 Tax=Alkalitalea saponilacus TaxID=889453 RepID=A0A1T5HSN5_9BACT|nr:DUF2723 domain-containing protein [Alkalitalea saponilacus]ASB49222.1 hypothetical protein CDL62_08760 [Alkalitalea saponilacus]SKC23705.1 Protein of unknown function [Alkalitalea saponilacus]